MTKAKTKAHPKLATRPQPSERDRLLGEEAQVWFLSKPDPSPPKISVRQTDEGVTQLGPSYEDLEGWSCRWAKALGTHSKPLLDGFIRHALAQTGLSPKSEPETLGAHAREAVAFIAALEPQSELEAALALQIWSVHCATMKMSGHLHKAEMRDALSDYSRMMNQTSRTFTALVEALSKLRTGGKQQVEVRYVYVDARTQNVVNGGAGGGVPLEIHQQPQGPGTVGLPFAPGVPVWSEDAGGDALPVAGDQRTEAMPDARGQEPGGTKGHGQRQLSKRMLDPGNDRGPPDSAGVGEDVP